MSLRYDVRRFVADRTCIETPNRERMARKLVEEGEATMESSPADLPQAAISKNRLEFLFDGIFAIAMTILVLELKVPEFASRPSVAELGHALLHDGPTFGSYVVSFLVLGIFWYRHNRSYRHLRHITKGMLALHLVQLAMAGFFPFAAALLGRYPSNGLSSVVYIACCMIYLWSAFFVLVVAHKAGAIDPSFSAANYLRERKGTLGGCVVLTLLFALYLLRVVIA
jgi:uncharacterized membrane protein